jgi:hypothetical protein
MCPNTIHYVVTIEPAFVYGQHFFTTSLIQESTYAIVHCFVMSNCITNALHVGLGTMLRRMMCMWHLHYKQGSPPRASQNPHVPDINMVDGLIFIMAVGNVLELAQVLDRRVYQKTGLHWHDQEEMAMGCWRYRLLQKVFAKYFVTFVGGQLTHPMSIFCQSLLEFAVTLVQYKTNSAPMAPKIPGCTLMMLKDKVAAYLNFNYPELVPAFKKMLLKESFSLHWSGPQITLRWWTGSTSGWSTTSSIQLCQSGSVRRSGASRSTPGATTICSGHRLGR